MIHIEEYCENNNISRRWVKELIDRGHLPSEKINGQRYILVPPSVDIINPSSQSPKEFKAEIRKFIKDAGKKYIQPALNRVAEFEKTTGIKLSGVSQRALYRIANNEQTVWHKTRADKGKILNSNMLAAKDKIEALSAKIYMDLGQQNIRFICTRMQEIARKEESLWDIAAIPQPTLYRYVSQFIRANGYDKCWLYYNNHKKWLRSLPKVYGAFTDDIDFMDYIAFDDRKADVAGSWYYNELTGKKELRKVWYWIAIEMLTMKPIGWVVLPREPNSDDVIDVLLQTMDTVGLPKKGYLYDNGIGNSERVKDFMFKIKQFAEGSEHFTRDFVPVAPYEPTHKANIERLNRFIKDEYDVFYKNYVGGSRDEVRHSGKRLMPEDCDHLVEEYIHKANAYLSGDCIDRTRDRVIKGKKYRASMQGLFEKYSESYQQFKLEDRSLRYALLDNKHIRTYSGTISIVRQGVRFNYVAADYNPALEGREFICAVLPTDLSTMDLYAAEDFYDHITGTHYERGGYVATVFSMQTLPSSERQRAIFKTRKQASHYARKSKEKILEAVLGQFPDLLELVNTHITIDGNTIDVRKQLLKRIQSITEAAPMNSIAEFIREEVKVIRENVTAGLTYRDEPEDIEENSSLTFNED